MWPCSLVSHRVRDTQHKPIKRSQKIFLFLESNSLLCVFLFGWSRVAERLSGAR